MSPPTGSRFRGRAAGARILRTARKARWRPELKRLSFRLVRDPASAGQSRRPRLKTSRYQAALSLAGDPARRLDITTILTTCFVAIAAIACNEGTVNPNAGLGSGGEATGVGGGSSGGGTTTGSGGSGGGSDPDDDGPMGPVDTIPGVRVDGQCYPLCAAASSDPDGDGWGWEDEASCIVSTSSLGGGESCGIDDGGGAPLNPDPPPGEVEKPSEVLSSGFFVVDGRLYDKFGNDFVIRGVNNAHVWFDTDDRWLAYDALDDISDLGFNTVRIVWETNRGAPSLLRQIVQGVVDQEMIPMIELHDVTGSSSAAELMRMAEYYAQGEVRQILLDFEDFLLVNIANEWSGSSGDYRSAYQSAVQLLRDSGVNHTLVIDANGYGQNADSVLDNAGALLESDPQHNLLFSVHMYESYAGASGRGRVTQVLEQAASAEIPLIVGEFGWQHGTPPQAIDAAFIMAECARLHLGYIPWSWKGNSQDLSYLDLAVDWEGQQLTDWGSNVADDPNGIGATSLRASIFLL